MNIVKQVGCWAVMVVVGVTAWAEEKVDPAPRVLVHFVAGAEVSGWTIEDDVVMGGRSKGDLVINEDGHAVFSGNVSLENDGGFSSLQWYFEPIDVSAYTTALLRVKGDGKNYQFRVEAEPGQRRNYVYEFATSGEWETIRVPLADMYPEHHGERLDLPNFPGQILSQVRFLIANARAESFQLLIEQIELR